MNRSTRTRRRVAAAAAAVVAAGVLTPLVAGGAVAEETAPAGPPPAAPAIVSPTAAGAPLKDVVLDWVAVVGAASYVVQVGTDEDWSDKPTLELPTVATRLTLPTSLPHASYVWRVAAVKDGVKSRWSSQGEFTRGWRDVPQRLTPAAGERVPVSHGVPTFSWTPVKTASEYQLQVSTSRYFDAPFNTQAGVTTESCFTTRTKVTPFNEQAQARNDGAGDCVFTLLGTGQTLYWRVRALDHVVDGAGEVNTTPVVDEGVSSLPPAEMNELDTTACPGEAKSDATPTASATPTATASPTATATAEPTASATPSASAAPAEGGGCEPAHTVEKGLWSASGTFSHAGFPKSDPASTPYFRDLATPAAPTLSTDVCDAAGVCRDFPTVSWTAVPNATWYRVYVSLDADYTNIHSIVETPATQWTPTDQWRESTAGAPYYVFVQPCTTSKSSTGQEPGCDEPSAPTAFKKKSPRVALGAPKNGAVLPGGEVLLSWQSYSEALAAALRGPATSEAYAYHLQVTTSDNPDFHEGALVEDVELDVTHHASPDVSYPDGDLLWRVQPVDASGHKLPWSEVRTFTRDAVPPTFAVSPMEKAAVDGELKVVWSEPVTGVASNTLRLRSTPSTTRAAGDGVTFFVKANSMMFAGAPYTVEASPVIRDAAGNGYVPKGVVVTTDALVDDRSKGLRLLGSWTRLAASNAVGGTYARSVPTPSAWRIADALVYGKGAEIKGCVGPANGIVEVWGDGVRLARLDTFRSYSGCGVVLAKVTFPRGHGLHRVEVRGMGQKSGASKGTAMGVDAITAQ